MDRRITSPEEAWARMTFRPQREVTAAEVVAHMREELARKSAEHARLDMEIKMLRAGVEFAEREGLEAIEKLMRQGYKVPRLAG